MPHAPCLMPQSNFELKGKLLQLEALHEVGRELNTLRPESELLEEVMHRAVAVLDPAAGFVFSLDEKLNAQSLYTFEVEATGEQLLAEPPVRQVIASREPI